MQKQPSPEAGQIPETKLQCFTSQQIPVEQLTQIKGGDGEDPPSDGVGHEDILDL
jgi:hypothetical protein